jgi:hypothetical protein
MQQGPLDKADVRHWLRSPPASAGLLLNPVDGSDMFLRNVGVSKLHGITNQQTVRRVQHNLKSKYFLLNINSIFLLLPHATGSFSSIFSHNLNCHC